MRKKLALPAVVLALFCAASLARRTAAGAADESPSSSHPAWRLALPGWQYRFPEDHAAHRDFKTEWWYFTGHLRETGGSQREFGYELTFFRQGVLPPGRRRAPALTPASHPTDPGTTGEATTSRFVQDDFKFAHLAVTDLAGRRFYCTQKATRGAFGEAGFGAGDATDPRLAWIEGWELRVEADGSWHIRARATDPDLSIDLRLQPRKAPVVHGIAGEGISRKAAGEGNASHYYSFTRMETSGAIAAGKGSGAIPVRGESWFDHEWASNGLGPEQIGWNWFCFQFDDNSELMLYAMRRRDGSIDPVSSGTLVAADGAVTHLSRDDFSLLPAGGNWRSPKTGATYPTVWQVKIPAHALEFTVRPRLDEQELALPQLSYWEGAMTVAGTRAGRPLSGRGYMELTGYAGPLVGLSR